MFWDTRLTISVWNSIWVSGGAATLSTLVALFFLAATHYWRVKGSRFLESAVPSMVTIPIYVQAVCWSAGFGTQGWFRFSLVDAANSKWYAISACVLIHATASYPLAFWFLRLGLQNADTHRIHLRLIDRSPIATFILTVIPSLKNWIAVAFLFVFALTTSDMVVTNLFGVPTLTEVLYQGVQFDRNYSQNISAALLYTLTLGSILTVLFQQTWKHVVRSSTLLGVRSSFPVSLKMSFPWNWLLNGAAWVAIAICALLPILNLFIKSGWHVTQSEGKTMRMWSIATLFRSMLDVKTFGEEFYWSGLLSFSAALIAVLVSSIWVVVTIRFQYSAALIFPIICAWIVPGPLVNYWVQSCFQLDVPWVQQLNNQSLAAPILGLQFRLIPIAFFISLTYLGHFRNRHRELLLLEPIRKNFVSSVLPFSSVALRPILLSTLCCFVLAFANLESYLLVLPPGVTPVSMRLFELLHYGVQNKEAALGAALVVLSLAISFCVSLIAKRVK